jgi:hypothetical protein
MNIYDLGPGSSSCDGTGKQNSAALLRTNVGVAPPDTTPPTIAFQSPHPGDVLPAGFSIALDVEDARAIASVDIVGNGQKITELMLPPWSYDVPAGSIAAGALALSATARDTSGNQAMANLDVMVKRLGETPGDLGTHCSASSDCNSGGFCSADHGNICLRECSSQTPCPGGFSCELTKTFAQQCVPLGGDSGCAAAPATRAPTGLGPTLLALIPIALAGSSASHRRRRREQAGAASAASPRADRR